MYFVYFIESLKNSKIYVGKTSKKPTLRLKEHNKGTNKWTKENGPFRLINFEKYVCAEDAGSREFFYKMGFGKAIKKLIVEYIKASNIGE